MIWVAAGAPLSSVPINSSTNTFFWRPLAKQPNVLNVVEALSGKSSGFPLGLDVVNVILPLPSCSIGI